MNENVILLLIKRLIFAPNIFCIDYFAINIINMSEVNEEVEIHHDNALSTFMFLIHNQLPFYDLIIKLEMTLLLNIDTFYC